MVARGQVPGKFAPGQAANRTRGTIARIRGRRPDDRPRIRERGEGVGKGKEEGSQRRWRRRQGERDETVMVEEGRLSHL